MKRSVALGNTTWTSLFHVIALKNFIPMTRVSTGWAGRGNRAGGRPVEAALLPWLRYRLGGFPLQPVQQLTGKNGQVQAARRPSAGPGGKGGKRVDGRPRLWVIKPFFRGGCSSVGRVPGCGPGCRGFESHQSPHEFPTQKARTSPGLLFFGHLFREAPAASGLGEEFSAMPRRPPGRRHPPLPGLPPGGPGGGRGPGNSRHRSYRRPRCPRGGRRTSRFSS